ncbi:phosphotransferase family protein [Chitinophaga solisilvae]|uniref:phosphotransferase family protein n=1 Tax=Chitinophaga solisilvae TaxID=1233460 RepID=UPI00136CC02A|nr:aminoglycoside phosphotransferase family protein [Chitinophaga solisilvae]
MHIDQTTVQRYLETRYQQVQHLKHMADGWWAQAFSFTGDQRQLVIRISRHIADFRKDEYARTHFSSAAIPIPRIIATGPFSDGLYYCISAYCTGTPADDFMETLTTAAALPVAASLLETLQHIHQLDTQHLSGWGHTDANGNGMFDSWEAWLSAIYNHKTPVSWQELAAATWLEADLFRQLITRMESLYPYLPREKKILHGDYGFDNVLLTPDGKISAVLDWSDMQLGDELFDLIHMNEPWINPPESVNYLQLWLEDRQRKGIATPHVNERVTCYSIYYTLLHLHIYTTRQDEDSYREVAAWAKSCLL